MNTRVIACLHLDHIWGDVEVMKRCSANCCCCTANTPLYL